MRVGDRYYLYTAANSGQTKADVSMIWTQSLDPASPAYKWSDPVVVASSDGIEDANAIDPGLFQDPNDGRLWLTYGSYFGYIRLVELDPKTGKRLRPNQAQSRGRAGVRRSRRKAAPDPRPRAIPRQSRACLAGPRPTLFGRS